MESWRNYIVRFSSLLVTGAILSACYAPVVTPTQSEVVIEDVVSEVVTLVTEQPTMESTVTNTPSPTFTPRPPPVQVDMETLELMASEWPSTDLFSVEQITFGDLLSIVSKVYSGAGGSEATIEDGLLSHLAHQGIFTGDKYPEMDEIIQGPVEAYVNTKLDLTSFSDIITAPEPTITPTPTIIPTPAPEGYVPQIYIGITKDTVNSSGINEACGSSATIITTDYDKREGYTKNFWENYSGIPGPGYRYRTRDQRRAMDVCVWPGKPIIFQMDEGKILENRGSTDNRYSDRYGATVLQVLITKGEGRWEIIMYSHYHQDLDPSTPEIEYLKEGTIVRRGDLLGYTAQWRHAWSVLMVGMFRANNYHPLQEMMLIGTDGQLNLIRP